MIELIVHFTKYSLVGILNAIFTIAVYFALLKALHMHYLMAFSISWASGVLLTYSINFLWVFKPEENISFKNRFWKYVLIFVTSYLINITLLKHFTEWIKIDPFIIQLFILPLVVMINFCGVKYWALK
jgi:putative flippase GtrA